MTNEESQISRFEMRGQGPSNVNAAASEKVQAASRDCCAGCSVRLSSTVQRVGNKYWEPAAALGKILVNGNPDGIELQTLLDNAVAGITAAGDL